MTDPIQTFVARWENSGAAERANYQLFLSELCDIIGVDHPDPATPDIFENAYVFERAVTFHHRDGTTSTGRIDLYKRGCFVLEAKQGVEQSSGNATTPLSTAVCEKNQKRSKGIGRRGSRAWDNAMHRAHGQAKQYIGALPSDEGRPPFMIVVDVGHSIELYSEFSCSGGSYIAFPAPGSHRIFLADLEDEEVRDRLRTIWTNPSELDPARKSAKVTREIADRLAKLAVALEKENHDPHEVASFLMRCLFTMFAEDIGLLVKDGFTDILEGMKETPEHFVPVVEELWGHMNLGGFSTILRTQVLQFNGGLFEDASALPLSQDQLLLLIEAAKCDWRDVEPAIFGTLLERALDPVERHKLGAHYTPRAYVERLVMPTIIEPVRADWEAAKAAAMIHLNEGQKKKAVAEIETFHRKLVNIRVLDPACGSGNFLYVTLEHLKRIEGEVFDTLDSLDERQTIMELTGVTVNPQQLLGLEVNPRAAAIAELVLWIGTLQWHFRNRGQVMPPQPVIKNFHNIECRDALIEWDTLKPLIDDNGEPVTHWDGRTTKPHVVTGKGVPDESARVPVMSYTNPRRTEWPTADYVVGNPPFIGPSLMRQTLGDGYTEAVRKAHPDISSSSDFVMYWWNHAAHLAQSGKIRQFGFVSTNSLRQKFNRRVLEKYLGAKMPISFIFAIPDHPWVDSADGAAVRIAMTCASAGEGAGLLQQVIFERKGEGDGVEVKLDKNRGIIQADLTIGTNVAGASVLAANQELSNRGVCLFGKGFVITESEAADLGLGQIDGLQAHIRKYRNGRDLASISRDAMVIDLFGLTAEEARIKFPYVYQWVLERVKPERDQNKRASRRDNWWLFGETNPKLRRQLDGLSRFIATVETSKHRFFQFLDASILPDNMLVNIALNDAYFLGILSSRIHVGWALASGGTLEDRPRYNKSRCFETFPFPDPTPEQRQSILDLAEQLDSHRKTRQAEYPNLTITGMYNVLEKLRSNEKLETKEKVINENGLVSVLLQLHDDLDTAVLEAYGWPRGLTNTQILERLVALNTQRAAEESRGQIRYLRPEFQNPSGGAEQTALNVHGPKTKKCEPRTRGPKLPWPKTLPDQVGAVRTALTEAGQPTTAEAVARRFVRARTTTVVPILETLVTVGQAHITPDGRFVGGS